MKKLNITKKQYDESKYFNNKYGALKFVSESGKLYKTDKGVVIALESAKDDDDEGEPKDDVLDDIGGDAGDAGEGGEGGDEEVTVKKEDLASALQGVIDTVKDIAAENDVELPEDEKDDDDEGDDDEKDDEGEDEIDLEFDEGDEKVCPTCGAAMKKECGGVKEECSGAGCVKKECGKPDLKLEAARRARRAKMVRESLLRRARAKKIRESIERRRRVRKVLESIRRRREAKKVLESARRRRLAKKVMESRKERARKVMESRRLRARRAGMKK